MDTRKILSLAGLCRRAGGVIPGADAVISSLKRGTSPRVVFVSAEASDRTKKQICDKTKHNGIPLGTLSASPDEIGHALGLVSPCAVFGITGKGPYEKLVTAVTADQEEN